MLPTASLAKQKQQRNGTDSETPINFYHDPPTVELSLDDFEVYALKRVKVNAQPGLPRETIQTA